MINATIIYKQVRFVPEMIRLFNGRLDTPKAIPLNI